MMDSCLLGAKPLSELVLDYCKLHTLKQISVKFELKYNNFHKEMNFVVKHVLLLC